MIPMLWQALDEIPGATTDAYDWQRRLGPEFPQASRYLRRTGRLAQSIDCPSPGGEGCPREVIRLDGETCRAVCRSRSSSCDSIDLRQDDIAVLALDHRNLIADLAKAFGFAAAEQTPRPGRIIAIGEYAVAAGVAAPVFLLIPGPRDKLTGDDLRAAGLIDNGSIVLVPCRKSISQEMRARLAEAQHLVISLSDITRIGAGGTLELVQMVDVLLEPVRSRLMAQIKEGTGVPAIRVPPGTSWAQITLVFISDETLICTTPNGSQQIDPGDLGMRSRMKGAKATKDWTHLLVLARGGGRLPMPGPKEASRFQKRMQLLNQRLQELFGISEPPVPWDPKQHTYAARFIIRDERTLRQRRGEAGR